MAVKYVAFLLFALAFEAVPFVNAVTPLTCQIDNLNVIYPSAVTSNVSFRVSVSFYSECVGFGAEYRVMVLDRSGNLVGEAASTTSHIAIPVTVRGLGSNSLIVQISMVNGSAYGEIGSVLPLTVSSRPTILTHPDTVHGSIGEVAC